MCVMEAVEEDNHTWPSWMLARYTEETLEQLQKSEEGVNEEDPEGEEGIENENSEED